MAHRWQFSKMIAAKAELKLFTACLKAHSASSLLLSRSGQALLHPLAKKYSKACSTHWGQKVSPPDLSCWHAVLPALVFRFAIELWQRGTVFQMAKPCFTRIHATCVVLQPTQIVARIVANPVELRTMPSISGIEKMGNLRESGKNGRNIPAFSIGQANLSGDKLRRRLPEI